MLETIGERIAYCRNLLQLKQSEVVKLLNNEISQNSLTRWETNVMNIRDKKLFLLVNLFQSKNLKVEFNWLKFGVGKSPYIEQFEISQGFDYDVISHEIIKIVKKIRTDIECFQLTDNFCELIATNGDYIWAIFSDKIVKFSNKLCLVKARTSIYMGYFDYKTMQIKNLNNEIRQFDKKHDLIGRVIYIGKYF